VRLWHCILKEDKTMQDMEKLHHLGGGEFCSRWDGQGDVRGYQPPAGFEATADLTDCNPVTGEPMAVSEWWMFLKPKGGEQ
jgi:hypothetical protein